MKDYLLIPAIAAAAAVTFIPIRVDAQVLTTLTNWDTGYFNTNNGYTRNDSLPGTPSSQPPAQQFQTTDPYNGGTGLGDNTTLDFIAGTTLGGGVGSASGNNSVYFGGAPVGAGPNIADPAQYRNFTTLLHGDAQEKVSFSTDFRLIENGTTQFDSWSFDLRDASGATTLVSFLFEYDSGTKLNVSGNGVNFGQIEYDGLYNLTATLQDTGWSVALSSIATTTDGGGDVTGFITNAPGAIGAGTISSSLTATDFESAYVSWLLDGGNPNSWGDNYMVINKMDVTSEVIPEPGTWAMGALLLSGALFVINRRRKMALASEGI